MNRIEEISKEDLYDKCVELRKLRRDDVGFVKKLKQQNKILKDALQHICDWGDDSESSAGASNALDDCKEIK